MRVIAIYPGRFHPFHKGHAASFKQLASNFGLAHTYLAVSEKQEQPKSPFSAGDRAKMAMALGIPKENIISVRNTYGADEYIKRFEAAGIDPNQTALVFGVSGKDMGSDPRFSFAPKRDGSPGYLQPYSDKLQPMTKHGYVLTTDVAQFPIAGSEMTDASQIRAAYAKGDEKMKAQILNDLYGKAGKLMKPIFDKNLQLTESIYKKIVALKAKINEAKLTEGTADDINKMFGNMYDPTYSGLQRVAILAMQGRQDEAMGQLQRVIKDSDPDVQAKIIDAVNSIEPVTINGRIADSSTLDKSKQHQDWIKDTFIPWVEHCISQGKQNMSEAVELSIQQLAAISDEALDNAYGYGRSTPGNSFGWQANLMSAAYAKKMIDAGVTDIDQIADAIHKGWNVTARKFVQNPDQFEDTEKLRQAGKLDAKLAQRAKLMKINYAQLGDEEQEKDRVVARALLQAIRGQQDLAEGIVLNPGDLIDIFVKGKHKKNTVTFPVAKGIPNKNLDKVIELLITKYNINPNTIIYGPSKPEETNEDMNKELSDRHPMDFTKRSFMIKQIAKATGWDISDIELASDEEIQQAYDQYVKSESYLEEN
jgi:hypothetical protein